MKKKSLLAVLSILLVGVTGCVKKEHSVLRIDTSKDNKNIQYQTLENIHKLEGKFVSYAEYLQLSKKESY